MKNALEILRDAVGLIVHRPLSALGAVLPALVLMGAVGLFALLAAPEALTLDRANPDLSAVKSMPLLLTVMLAFVAGYALMAILWHRHTLGDAHAAQPMGLRLVTGYLWRVIALALIQFGAVIALVVPLIAGAQNAVGADGEPAMLSVLMTTFLTQLMLLWLSLRLSLILPAAALGHPITMAHSWRRTAPVSRSLWGVAAVLAVVNTVTATGFGALALARPTLVLMLEMPVHLIEGLLIFSVLTVLYARQFAPADDA